jgi:hypothetical protein
MTLVDYLGIFISVVLVGGLIWALVDLLIKIARRPKGTGPTDLTALSPYPLVPETIRSEKDRKKHRQQM